jgi:hypothetical protein
MNNQFKLNTLYLGGNAITADSSNLYVNGQAVSGGGGSATVTGENVVYITGNQLISGLKTFTGIAIEGSIKGMPNGGPGVTLSPTSYSWESAGFSASNIYNVSSSQPCISIADRALYSSSVTPALDWQNRMLSGNWNVIGSLSQSGHRILNTGSISGASGISIEIVSQSTVKIVGPPFSKSTTAEYPTAGESITMFYANRPMIINELDAIISGSNSPSVNYTMRFATGRQVVGTEINLGGSNCTNAATGDRQFTFANSYISGNTWVWLNINTTGGNPKYFHLTAYFNYV